MTNELKPLESALLMELEAAHLIIGNAIALMNIQQITKLAMVNGEMGLLAYGAARFDERAELIKQAYTRNSTSPPPDTRV